MKTKALAVIIAIGIFSACTKVPLTGRRQLNLLPQATLNSMSLTEYKTFLSTHTVTTHRKNIMNKLGVNNTAGLVLFAVRENLVSPNHFLFASN